MAQATAAPPPTAIPMASRPLAPPAIRPIPHNRPLLAARQDRRSPALLPLPVPAPPSAARLPGPAGCPAAGALLPLPARPLPRPRARSAAARARRPRAARLFGRGDHRRLWLPPQRARPPARFPPVHARGAPGGRRRQTRREGRIKFQFDGPELLGLVVLATFASRPAGPSSF
jgi:hypothetical protein